MDYSDLPEEKYIYYECFIGETGFTYIENENHIDQRFNVNSKIIRVSKYIPRYIHGSILRYYYRST